MPRRTIVLTLAATLALGACGGRDSGLNPFRWFGGGKPRGPESLTPAGGYDREDARQPIARILSARWEPLAEGRLLVVTAIAPTRGWWDPALVTATPMPQGRVRPDADGVLRLRFVAAPPPPDTGAGQIPARVEVDSITAAMPIPTAALDRIERVVIQGAGNAVTLAR